MRIRIGSGAIDINGVAELVNVVAFDVMVVVYVEIVTCLLYYDSIELIKTKSSSLNYFLPCPRENG